MNKIYFAHEKDESNGIYIAASSYKEAKKIASNTLDCYYIDLRIRSIIKNPVTNTNGVLQYKEIIELGCAWWQCKNCDCEILEYVKGDKYKCTKCGFVADIPYSD